MKHHQIKPLQHTLIFGNGLRYPLPSCKHNRSIRDHQISIGTGTADIYYVLRLQDENYEQRGQRCTEQIELLSNHLMYRIVAGIAATNAVLGLS